MGVDLNFDNTALRTFQIAFYKRFLSNDPPFLKGARYFYHAGNNIKAVYIFGLLEARYSIRLLNVINQYYHCCFIYIAKSKFQFFCVKLIEYTKKK